MNNTENKLCNNIFKNGKDTTDKMKVTMAWIKLINEIEKNKSNAITYGITNHSR